METESPYAGEQERQIKSLSQSEIDGYRDGSGLGYAKAAELNHYPGPKHVLELADEIGLSEEQEVLTRTIFDAMKKKAAELGNVLVEKEAVLDESFASGSVTPATLKEMIDEISGLEGQIRFAHLEAHLQQKEVLDEHQAKKYDSLRGYENHSGHNTH